MMKALLASLVLLGNSLAGFSQQPSLDGWGFPYKPRKVETVWENTNSLPPSVTVYRIQPKPFPELVVSNMMKLGNFTSADRTTPPFPGRNKGDIYYAKKDKKTSLFVSPAFGLVHFQNEGVRAFNYKLVEGVPDEKAAVALALQYLAQAGIDKSQLVAQDGLYKRLVERQFVAA